MTCKYERLVLEEDRMWFHNPRKYKGRAPKLQSYWEESYEIVKKINNVVFRIRKSRKHREKVVHSDRLANFVETLANRGETRNPLSKLLV